MEPTVQFDPGRCVLVLGPQIAMACLSLKDPAGVPPALSYNMLVEIGSQKMLDMDSSLTSKEDRQRKQALLSAAYELEPAVVASKMVETLRAHDKYEQWLSDMFASLYNLPLHNGAGSVVEDLRQLQDKGALLVYTYYDMIIDKALESPPVLMEEEEVKNWGSRKSPGVLHVHGVHSRPDTVMCDCVNYSKIVAESSAGRRLREICRNRTVICVGFDGILYDPFLTKFASAFLSGSGSGGGSSNAQTHSTSLLLTFTGSLAAAHPSLLNMRIPSMKGGLSKFLVPTVAPFKPG